MSKTIKTEDKTLEVNLFDEGRMELESGLYKNIGIGIKRVDPSKEIGCPK